MLPIKTWWNDANVDLLQVHTNFSNQKIRSGIIDNMSCFFGSYFVYSNRGKMANGVEKPERGTAKTVPPTYN